MLNTMTWLDIKFHHGTDNPTDVFVPDYQTSLDSVAAAAKTIKSIHQKFPKPIILCCTGGVDSQAMLHAWHLSGVSKSDIKVVSFIYDENSNLFDIKGTPQLCDKLGFYYEQIPFELKTFLDSGEYFTYQKMYWTTSPQMAAHMKMVEFFDHGTVIMSGTAGVKENLFFGSTTVLSEYYYANIQNNKTDKKKFIPFFFQHDKNIGTAFYDHHRKHSPNMVDNKPELLYIFKTKAYQAAGLPVVPQDIDFSGFEEFKIFYDDVKLTLNEKLLWGQTDNPSRRPFDTLFRYKSQRDIKYCDYIKYT